MNGDEWLVLIPRLPSDPSRYRVSVWRELRRVGAVQLGQGTWALPADQRGGDIVARLAVLVPADVGDVLQLRAVGADTPTGEHLRAVFNEARSAEWAEFVAECGKAAAEVQREIDKQKFTLAELDEEEQNVERLRRWQRELRLRDRFGAADTAAVEVAVAACETVLAEFTDRVYEFVGLR